MSKHPESIACKRGAGSVESADMPVQPSKRSKNGSIVDYMRSKPRSCNRPQQKNDREDDETKSKYWSKTAIESKPNASRLSPQSKDDRHDQGLSSQRTASSPDNQPNQQTESANGHLETLRLKELTGDIFSAPPQTLIIHACNCEGSWGAGIALAFKKQYPAAFRIYASHCRDHGADLFGTALLIAAQKQDRQSHFVGCLFTSRSKGKKKDSPKQILEATGPAMMDLMAQARKLNEINDAQRRVGEVRMCKINSGLFAVPWQETAAVLEGIVVQEGDFAQVKVVSREE